MVIRSIWESAVANRGWLRAAAILVGCPWGMPKWSYEMVGL